MMRKILEEIVHSTLEAVAIRKHIKPVDVLKQELADTEPPRQFEEALHNNGMNLIAEVKMASPSRGKFNVKLSITELAITYAAAGASAISVVTQDKFFHGSLSHLKAVKSAVRLPVLCKDFIVDPYQIYEARWYGADAVLLIASILGLSKLKEFCNIASDLGMSALVEVHNLPDLEKALVTPTRLIGINNRNLYTLEVSLDATLKLSPVIPLGINVVSESGIRSADDVKLLREAGIRTFLVGESLVTSAHPAQKIAELLGRHNYISGTPDKSGVNSVQGVTNKW